MNSVQIKAYAKINLTLDITGANGGFHDLDSVVATINLYDLITIKKRKDDKITVEMHGLESEYIPYENNNAVRAAKAFQNAFSCDGVDIVIYKNIPIGAGLGGSSADVAGVLNGMQKLFDVDDRQRIIDVANSLGSDCVYMLDGGFARLFGRGDKVCPIDADVRLDVLILFAEGGVSTAQCYREYDSLAQPYHPNSLSCENALKSGDLTAVGKHMGNALYAPACAINPHVKRAYEQLLSFDPLGVSMTGSGSAVVALFENDQFTQYAKSRYTGEYETFITHTLNPTKRSKIWQKKD